jgi:hypothetical protein
VPRPRERKKAVIIGPAATAHDERRTMIFRGRPRALATNPDYGRAAEDGSGPAAPVINR